MQVGKSTGGAWVGVEKERKARGKLLENWAHKKENRLPTSGRKRLEGTAKGGMWSGVAEEDGPTNKGGTYNKNLSEGKINGKTTVRAISYQAQRLNENKLADEKNCD